MSRLFETIKVAGGRPQNLDYHNERLNRARHELFGCKDIMDLNGIICIPPDAMYGVHKCRVVYGENIEGVEFSAYQRRTVRSLSLVECDSIEYEHKFVDRSRIDALMANIVTDDILIVKRGYIADTSTANIVFFDGAKWVTSSTPLLPGTTRARLLSEQKIIVREITKRDIRHFAKAALMNAMIDLDEAHSLNIENIV